MDNHTFDGEAWALEWARLHQYSQGPIDDDLRHLCRFVADWRAEFPFGPGTREIERAMGFVSTQTVRARIRRAADAGLLAVHVTDADHFVTRSLDVTEAGRILAATVVAGVAA